MGEAGLAASARQLLDTPTDCGSSVLPPGFYEPRRAALPKLVLVWVWNQTSLRPEGLCTPITVLGLEGQMPPLFSPPFSEPPRLCAGMCQRKGLGTGAAHVHPSPRQGWRVTGTLGLQAESA